MIDVVVGVDNDPSGGFSSRPVPLLDNVLEQGTSLVNSNVARAGAGICIDVFKEPKNLGHPFSLSKLAPGNHHTTWSTDGLHTV